MKRSGTRQFNNKDWIRLKKFYKNRCVRCGKKEEELDEPLTSDHVVPITMGGHRGIGNIQPMCRPCNQLKSHQLWNPKTNKSWDYRWRRFKS